MRRGSLGELGGRDSADPEELARLAVEALQALGWGDGDSSVSANRWERHTETLLSPASPPAASHDLTSAPSQSAAASKAPPSFPSCRLSEEPPCIPRWSTELSGALEALPDLLAPVPSAAGSAPAAQRPAPPRRGSCRGVRRGGTGGCQGDPPGCPHGYAGCQGPPRRRRVVLFSDYDGTLSPIVADPDLARLPEGARAALNAVSRCVPVGLLSGRGREKVQAFVGLPHLTYAGSHGLDIAAPVWGGAGREEREGRNPTDKGDKILHTPAAPYLPLMDEVFHRLEAAVAGRTPPGAIDGHSDAGTSGEASARTGKSSHYQDDDAVLPGGLPGATVEHNRFSVSLHFRRCPEPEAAGRVALALAARESRRCARLAQQNAQSVDPLPLLVPSSGGHALAPVGALLRVGQGRKVVEIRPDLDWDKGRALEYLLRLQGTSDDSDGPGADGGNDDVLVIYLGDDRTDEDAFAALARRNARLAAAHQEVPGGGATPLAGVGILVSAAPKLTLATHHIESPAEVEELLWRLAVWGGGIEGAHDALPPSSVFGRHAAEVPNDGLCASCEDIMRIRWKGRFLRGAGNPWVVPAADVDSSSEGEHEGGELLWTPRPDLGSPDATEMALRAASAAAHQARGGGMAPPIAAPAPSPGGRRVGARRVGGGLLSASSGDGGMKPLI